MIMTLVALQPSLLEAVAADPSKLRELTFDPAMDERMAAMGYPIDRTLEEAPVNRLSLEKDWQILHFALTKEEWGGEWPASFLMGGKSIGDDMGYGPGKLLSAKQVRDVAAYLEPLTAQNLLDEISADDLARAEIYPFHTGVPPEEFEEALPIAFGWLKSFVQKAAATGCSVFMYIA